MALILEGAATAAECAELLAGHCFTPAADRLARQGAALAAAAWGAPWLYVTRLTIESPPLGPMALPPAWATAIAVLHGAIKVGDAAFFTAAPGSLAVVRGADVATSGGGARILRVDLGLQRPD